MKTTLAFALLFIIGNSKPLFAETGTGGHAGGTAADGGMNHDDLNWGAPYLPCPTSDDKVSEEQMNLLRPILADRENRLKHVLWHFGSSGELDPQLDGAIKTAFGPGWKSPQECPAPKNDSGSRSYNAIGENFFYMHRQMRSGVNEMLKRKGLDCIGGWKEIPAANADSWPVPGGTADQTGAKSDAALEFMKEWQKMFKNPVWLKNHSLSQLGQLVEVTIHNNMHMRWADEANARNTDFPFEKKFLTDKKYPNNWNADAPDSDYLGNPYTAHVNPHFWKLHGLVDDLIDEWAKANGYQEVSADCGRGRKKRKGCYQWKGKWIGGKFETAAQRNAGTATLSMNPGNPESADNKAVVRGLATKKSKEFFKHVFNEDIKKDFKQAPKTRALPSFSTNNAEGTDNAAQAEYEANKTRWAQMERQMLNRICPSGN